MHMGERIKEERERLGFNQTDFATLASATRKTLFNWESGSAAPNAIVLAAWARLGLDVLYVVTGEKQKALPTADPAELLLLENYRRCGMQARQNLIQTSALLASGIGQSPAGASQVMSNAGSGSVQIGSIGGDYSASVPRKTAVRKSRPPSR